jgi:putative nucleotidyltransferase with HDIG domain
MLHRFKQLFYALNAKITSLDIIFVQNHLTPEEIPLFGAMDLVDQKHCLDVAMTCHLLAEEEASPLDAELLYKAALLHDIGKQQGYLSLGDRVVVVLLQTFLPRVFTSLSNKPHNPCYIAKNHPAIGAELCSKAGLRQDLIKLVELHHKGGPGKELKLLMKADSQN